VLQNFNADGFSSLYPRYAGRRPPKFTLPQRREIKKIAKSRPAEHGLPFSRWSLAKLADFLVAEGVVEDISHEGLRELLHAEGVFFQSVKTWKQSADPDYAAKKARIDHLYAVADGELGEPPRPRRRATYHRTSGTRQLFGALDLTSDKMYRHVKRHKTRTQFLEFCRYLRSLHPPQVRIAIICDNYSPHLTTRKDKRVGNWATANNTEIAYLPTNSSWMNRIEAQFTRCANSPSTAPTTPPTASRTA
jgi:transposase